MNNITDISFASDATINLRYSEFSYLHLFNTIYYDYTAVGRLSWEGDILWSGGRPVAETST
jgi:hypothetical protein